MCIRKKNLEICSVQPNILHLVQKQNCINHLRFCKNEVHVLLRYIDYNSYLLGNTKAFSIFLVTIYLLVFRYADVTRYLLEDLFTHCPSSDKKGISGVFTRIQKRKKKSGGRIFGSSSYLFIFLIDKWQYVNKKEQGVYKQPAR